MSMVRAQQNETFRGWYEIQRRASTPVKINGTKLISPFDEVGNHQPAKLGKTAPFRIILELF